MNRGYTDRKGDSGGGEDKSSREDRAREGEWDKGGKGGDDIDDRAVYGRVTKCDDKSI